MISDIEDCRSEFGPNLENPYDLDRERAVEAFSPRHRGIGSAIWNLPIGKGQWLGGGMPGFLDKIVGQWSLSSIVYLQTGSYFTPYFTGADISGTGLDRPQHNENVTPAGLCAHTRLLGNSNRSHPYFSLTYCL